MSTKKMNNNYKIFLVTIFATILFVHGDEQNKLPKDEDRCSPIKYIYPNIEDKPDLLITEEIIRPDDEHRFWTAICRIGSNKSEESGKLFTIPDKPFNNDFEYDSRIGAIYKGTFSQIQKILLADGKEKTIHEYFVNPLEGAASIDSIALDWATRNMYICRGGEVQIFALKKRSKSPKTIIKIEGKYFNPKVKVFPNEGYLVVTTSHRTLSRFDQDGSHQHVLYDNPNATIHNIALDHLEKKIYWIESENGVVQIRYINLNGDKAQTLQVTGNSNDKLSIGHLQLDEKYVYFVKGEFRKRHLLRANKFNGLLDRDFNVLENATPYTWAGSFESILVLSSPQVIDKDHPCQHDNGGCDGFCVAVPDESNRSLAKKCIDADTSVRQALNIGWDKVKSIFD